MPLRNPVSSALHVLLFALITASAQLSAAETTGHRLLIGYKEWTVVSKWSEKYEAWRREFVNPPDWRSPDYYNGHVYLRFEVIDKPTDDELNMQLCLWYGDYDTEGICEICINREQLPWFTFSRKGEVVYVKYPAISTWPRLHGRPWNDEPFRFMLFQLRLGTKELKLPEHPHHLGPESVRYLPVKWYAEAYVVPAGDTFLPPADWTGNPWGGVSPDPR